MEPEIIPIVAGASALGLLIGRLSRDRGLVQSAVRTAGSATGTALHAVGSGVQVVAGAAMASGAAVHRLATTVEPNGATDSGDQTDLLPPDREDELDQPSRARGARKRPS